jgi:hypothetical protein
MEIQMSIHCPNCNAEIAVYAGVEEPEVLSDEDINKLNNIKKDIDGKK